MPTLTSSTQRGPRRAASGMMNDRKVINLEEGWDFMQARPRETHRYARDRGSLAARRSAPVFRANVTLRGSDAAHWRARSDLLPSFTHKQKGIVKLRGILEKEQGEDAFTPQEYMNMYTCVPQRLPRLRSHLATLISKARTPVFAHRPTDALQRPRAPPFPSRQYHLQHVHAKAPPRLLAAVVRAVP